MFLIIFWIQRYPTCYMLIKIWWGVHGPLLGNILSVVFLSPLDSNDGVFRLKNWRAPHSEDSPVPGPLFIIRFELRILDYVKIENISTFSLGILGLMGGKQSYHRPTLHLADCILILMIPHVLYFDHNMARVHEFLPGAKGSKKMQKYPPCFQNEVISNR